jgi:hypothetical protein
LIPARAAEPARPAAIPSTAWPPGNSCADLDADVTAIRRVHAEQAHVSEGETMALAREELKAARAADDATA